MIGERINPTGRKLLAEEMARGDYSRVLADAVAQVEAGAQMLDVNAGIPLVDEPAILAECIKLVQDTVDVPLSIDSSIVAALEAGLAVYRGKPLVNSVTGEEERLEQVLPLVKKYGAAVVAISNDETGISEDPDVRFAVAKKIVQRAADFGIPREDIVVDPLVMPVGAINDAGRKLIHLLRRLREELKVNTTCGASNFSFGLPNRRGLNAAFLPMMIGAGMTSAIMNPLHNEDIQAILGADVVMGTIPTAAPGSASSASRRRRVPPNRCQPRRPPPYARAEDSILTDHLVVFTPSGKRGRFPEGTSVLEAARQLGVDLDSVCGGRGICGRCQVEVGEGSFSKHGIESPGRPCDRLERGRGRATSASAARWPAAAASAARRRLRGDLVIDVPPDSQVHRQVVRKRAEAHPIEIDPVVRLAYVEVAAARHARPRQRFPPPAGRAGRAVAVRGRDREPPGARRGCRRPCARATGP